MFLPELVKNQGYVVHFSEENGTFLLYKKLEEDHNYWMLPYEIEARGYEEGLVKTFLVEQGIDC